MNQGTPKSLFTSKTAAFNFLLLIAGAAAYFLPGADQWIGDNTPLVLGLIGTAGLILRRVTNSALVLYGAMFAFLLLPSCGVQLGPDGKPMVTLDPVAASQLSRQILDQINAELAKEGK